MVPRRSEDRGYGVDFERATRVLWEMEDGG